MSLTFTIEFEDSDTDQPVDATGTPTIVITRLDTATVITPDSSDHPSTGVYTWTIDSPVSGKTYRGLWSAVVAGDTLTDEYDLVAETAATGDIIDGYDVLDFLGESNLDILSQRDPTATTSSDPNIQRAIDKAEAMVKSILGKTYLLPLTVSGVPVKTAVGSIAKPLVQAAACQFAGFWLNKWRSVQVSNQSRLSDAQIDQMASAWEEQATLELQANVEWAEGYSEARTSGGVTPKLSDLDLRADAPANTLNGSIMAPVMVGNCCRPRNCYPWGYWG